VRLARPAGREWRDAIAWVTLDLAGSYRAVADTMLPHADQVADPFHPVRAGNDRLDDTRRRVQQQVLGHRGRKHDPLYRTRRLLVIADERLDDDARQRRRGLLAAGDPRGEVADAWMAKEAVREIYRIDDTDLALEWVTELAATLNDRVYGPEVRRLGRMLARWAPQIAAWHRSRASNGPVEAINGLAKRVKRVAGAAAGGPASARGGARGGDRSKDSPSPGFDS
jgi:transposase